MSVNLDRESPEVYSYRPSERHTGLIDHTYVAGLERVKTPKSLLGARVRGEIYVVGKDGKPVPNRALGGILNSSPMRGRNKLTADEQKVRFGIFDVVSGPGDKSMEGQPWGEKLKVLRRVAKSMKQHGFHVPDVAVTPSQQKSLYDKIRKGKHHQSNEGMVEWDLDQPGDPNKIVFRPHRQVFVHQVFEGTGRFKDKAVRYTYSLRPGGPPIGFVGTGFTEDQRKWMWDNRDKLSGMKAVIKSKEQFPSGAYRAPSHSHFHL